MQLYVALCLERSRVVNPADHLTARSMESVGLLCFSYKSLVSVSNPIPIKLTRYAVRTGNTPLVSRPGAEDGGPGGDRTPPPVRATHVSIAIRVLCPHNEDRS